MRRRTLAPLLSLLILSLLLAPCVLASAGVSGPSKEQRTFDFEPGKVISIGFFLHGAPHLSLLLEGDLAEYATVDDPAPNGSDRWVTLSLTLPDELEPGLHAVYVGAMEASLDQQGMFGGRAGAMMGVYVKVLSNEPVIKGKLVIDDVSENSSAATGTLQLESWTKQPLSGVYANIGLVQNGTFTQRTTTGTKDLASNAKVSYDVRLPIAGLKPGLYDAQARVLYAGRTLELNDTFRIGTRHVSLVSYTQKITRGVINRFSFSLLSSWNLRLNNVFGTVSLADAQSTSPTGSLAPFSRQEFDAYVDATNMEIGTQQGTLSVTFENKSTMFPITVEVIKQNTSAVVQPEPEKTEPGRAGFFIPFNTMTLLYLLVLLLVIINLYLIFRRRR